MTVNSVPPADAGADAGAGAAAGPGTRAGADTPTHTDALTGLANRPALEAFLAQRDTDPSAPPLALMAVELSRFGRVTDSVGAELGNRIIVMVARRLRRMFAHAALIARTHGDHFCLVFEAPADIDEQIAQIQDFAQRPLALQGEVIVLSVRLGIAHQGPLVAACSPLLHAAEVALHQAKREKLKRCFYQHALAGEAQAAHRLENDLRVSLVNRHADLHRAIHNDEFRILYQPIVDASRPHRVHAMEALIRWHHPQRGVISPVDFIPMAEQIQVMDVLGNWIMRRACMDAARFPANDDGTLPGISINVSPMQFVEADLLLATVRQALDESGIAPGRLKLEITESTAFGPGWRHAVERCRALGCEVALDDFGTGYSSLTQLNTLPLDYLKLDRSFIRHLGGDDPDEDRRSDRMTRAVLSLARTFDLTPIVEGVETPAQRDRLLGHGATLMQGYLFSRPVPLAQACAFVSPLNPTRARGTADA